MTVHNRYDFLNLKDNVTFHWAVTNDRDTIARGAFSPDCAPRSSVPYSLSIPAQKGLALLHFNIEDKEGHTFLRQSFVLNKAPLEWTGCGDPMLSVQETAIRTGRKPTMAERITQKGRLLRKYLLPIGNEQVKAEVQTTQEGTATKVSFTLTPDTADVFRSELGLAYLLSPAIDRVQWIGQGPFASYPGRHQANRYGFWAKHKDDLYFEGNHGGIDAAFFSDKEGNGLLVVGDSLDINFEQTDRGIVMTVNAAVSGQGPKFARTAFPAVSKKVDTVAGRFHLYKVAAGAWPRLFANPQAVPAPFHPFETQYDTYLLRFNDIYGN